MSDASGATGTFGQYGLEGLDNLPMGGWIALMVIGFVVFWPIGLAILIYLIWSGKMQSWRRSRRCGRRHGHRGQSRSTGNSAFDAYRSETLKRLEEEQEAFHAFLDRLRRAKDQAEFDQFMAERGDNGDAQPQA